MASIAVPKHGIAEVVHSLKEHKPITNASSEHPQEPPLAQPEQNQASPDHSRHASVAHSSTSKHPRKSSVSGYRHPPPGTPSGRTGPPRSISYSYHYSLSGHGPSRNNSGNDEDAEHANGAFLEYEDFGPINSPFRGVLDPVDSEKKGEEAEDRKGKKRESSSYFPENWKPFRWTESPKLESAPYRASPDLESEFQHNDTIEEISENEGQETPRTDAPARKDASPSRPPRRARSLPHLNGDAKASPAPKWSRLKSLLPSIISQGRGGANSAGPSAVIPQSINITDELIAGGLSTLMLRLWFERDEGGHRRVPILFHRLRIRVSDSLHPMHGHKAVFRIECEYANGAARWVVYRQLREFVSLHTHYTLSNAYNRQLESLPDFPKTSAFRIAHISHLLLIVLRSTVFQVAEGERQRRRQSRVRKNAARVP